MERKHFKCYVCHEHNNFYIQINKIGNWCKSCCTFNYFAIKRNRNNNSRFNNMQISQSEEIILNRQILINILPNIFDENIPLLSSNNQNNISNNNNNTNLILPNEYDNFLSFSKQNNSTI